MARIVLYIPSRIYGGAERQMALLACLAADDGHEVTLIDSKAGIVAKMVANRADIKVVIACNNKNVEVRDSIIITQASYAFCLDKFLDIVNCDVRFWFMHELNLPHMYVQTKLPSYLGKFFSLTLNWFYKRELQRCSSSFFFMGLDLKKSIELHYNLRFNSDVTGMLSGKKVDEVSSGAHRQDFSATSLCWLGRLDKSSKSLIIKKLMMDFSESALKSGVSTFDIIGDGKAKEELVLYSKSLGISKYVCFHGHVDFEDLSSIIARSCILFAHGTSVYEGVYANVPVCLVDFYLKSDHLKDMKYEFYAEAEGNDFGNVIKDIDDPKISSGDTFDGILELAVSNRSYILARQQNKLHEFVSTGEERCRSLFAESAVQKNRPRTFFLDVLFFKLKSASLRIRRWGLSKP